MTNQLDIAFAEGRYACRTGERFTANPYEAGRGLATRWEEGWWNAWDETLSMQTRYAETIDKLQIERNALRNVIWKVRDVLEDE